MEFTFQKETTFQQTNGAEITKQTEMLNEKPWKTHKSVSLIRV